MEILLTDAWICLVIGTSFHPWTFGVTFPFYLFATEHQPVTSMQKRLNFDNVGVVNRSCIDDSNEDNLAVEKKEWHIQTGKYR